MLNESEEIVRMGRMRTSNRPKTLWIDLDNSPHIPFFVPIIEELEKRGYSVVVTTRECFQVCDLADLFHLTYRRVGRHWGRHQVMKGLGTTFRALQLLPIAWREKPDLAVSHGSRSQLLTATIAGIPSLVIFDYEFARPVPGLRPTCVMVPEVIPDSALQSDRWRVLKYPGIKEDVYVSRFNPDASIRCRLGLNGNHVVVTLRPPANEAHYHNPESEELFRAVMELLRRSPATTAILLPRNAKQAQSVLTAWPDLFSAGKVIIPNQAVDGLNLIWYSDLVISGGGTMNREAAALGVPVYSIFRGRIGAVDRYLSDRGRLILLESVEDVNKRIVLRRRQRPTSPHGGDSTVLNRIVDSISTIVEQSSDTTGF